MEMAEDRPTMERNQKDEARMVPRYPDEQDTRPMRATDICSKAIELVGGARDREHGSKVKNHNNIAVLWTAYLSIRRNPLAPLSALDVAEMMVLLKVARTQTGALNMDDFIDQAGYAGCAGEIALAEGT